MDLLDGIRMAFGDWVKRLGWGFIVTLDESTELGFLPADVVSAKRTIEATAAPADLLSVAMDAARFYNESLGESTRRLIGIHQGKTRDLRRSGYESERDVRAAVKGMAKATAPQSMGSARFVRLVVLAPR